MWKAVILAVVSIALASFEVAAASDTHNAAPAATSDAGKPAAMHDLLEYARGQNTTGFLVMQDGKTLVEESWPTPKSRGFDIFVYGKSSDGQLLEDVASEQKSFVAVLLGIAIDKGLIDVNQPVSQYVGSGWTKASPAQEAQIRLLDVLTMSSGLKDTFAYEAPPGTRFLYNTAVYAITKKVLTAASKLPLDEITRRWLTEPLGMKNTAWRQRPAALAGVGNNTGLVTTPRDIAIFGEMILAGGVAHNGTRVISASSLKALFARSCCNPAYGRLWWLNGGDYVFGPDSQRQGPLIPAAPPDLVAAFGYLDRRLYVVPSLKLIVVRNGAAPTDKGFDQALWLRLMRVLPPPRATHADSDAHFARDIRREITAVTS